MLSAAEASKSHSKKPAQTAVFRKSRSSFLLLALRFLAPLTIPMAHLDEGLDILDASLEKTAS